MNKTIEERVEAIERWITAFEIEEEQFTKERVVFIPAPGLLRDRKKDH